jgi:acetoin:2,6-dichlorophenolindophenol oxidoreductase subunit beta
MMMSFAQALNLALQEEMVRDERVFVAGEEVGISGGIYGVTKGLLDQFGSLRVKDMPISEAAIIGLATGAAAAGLRPVVEIMYQDFMAVCMDQIVNQAAKMPYMFGGKLCLPMVIRTQCGIGRHQAAQHSQSLEAWFAHIPGLKVVMPSTPSDAKGLLKAAIRDDNPVVFIEHKMLYSEQEMMEDKTHLIPIGKAAIARTGQDVTLVSYSWMMKKTMEAAVLLSDRGIHCEVIDLRTIKPLDMETVLDSVKKTGRLVVIQEGVLTGGIGAEIAATVAEKAFAALKAPIRRVAAPDTPVPFSPVLEEFYTPSVENILAVVEDITSN